MDDETFLTAWTGGDEDVIDGVETTSVPWWSFTKTALATAALALVAQGRLRLDEKIDDRRITLRQLLQHRAGVPNYGGLAQYHDAVNNGERPWPAGELLDRVDAAHLDFEPGAGWRYSNVGYFFVRQIIERAVDDDIAEAFRTLVFAPLGLNSVRFARRPADLVEMAWGNDILYDPGWVYHGLLTGTAGDAVRFLHRLRSGQVLSSDLLDQMATPHPIGDTALPGRPWMTTGYGLGLMTGRMVSVGRAIGHSGAGPGSVCAVYHFVDRETPCTAAAFAKGGDEGGTEHEVARLVRTISG